MTHSLNTKGRAVFAAKNLRFLSLAIVSFFLFLSTNNSNANAMPFFKEKQLPTTPISIPIDISKKGNKAEIDVRIESKKEKEELEPESTAFELEFVPYDPERDPKSKYYISPFRERLIMIGALEKYFKPEYTEEEKKEISKDRYSLLKLLGGGIPIDTGRKYHSYIDYPAVPIPNIHLTIINLDDPDKKIVFDEVLEVKKNNRVVSYFMKSLTRVNIEPGNYKIITAVASDALEFSGTKVFVKIGSYRAKI